MINHLTWSDPNLYYKGAIKKDGKREKFNRDKLFRGVEKNLEKRPFSTQEIEEIVNDIEARIYRAAKDKDIKRLTLHSAFMKIKHPFTKEEMIFESQAPAYFKALVNSKSNGN